LMCWHTLKTALRFFLFVPIYRGSQRLRPEVGRKPPWRLVSSYALLAFHRADFFPPLSVESAMANGARRRGHTNPRRGAAHPLVATASTRTQRGAWPTGGGREEFDVLLRIKPCYPPNTSQMKRRGTTAPPLSPKSVSRACGVASAPLLAAPLGEELGLSAARRLAAPSGAPRNAPCHHRRTVRRRAPSTQA